MTENIAGPGGPSSEVEAPDNAALANQLMNAGDYDGAAPILVALAEKGHRLGWVAFQQGRIAAHRQRYREAVEGFSRALQAALGSGQASPEAEAGVPNIARELAFIVQLAPEQLAPMQYPTFQRAADESFKVGAFVEAEVLYKFLSDHGHGGMVCKLRYIDLSLRHGRPTEALRELDALPADPHHAGWMDSIRAGALLGVGQPEAAAALLESLIAKEPENSNLVRRLFQALDRTEPSEAHARSRKYLNRLDVSREPELFLRSHLYCEDFDGFSRAYAALPEAMIPKAANIAARAVNLLIDKQQPEALDRLLDQLMGVEPRQTNVTSAILAGLQNRARWAETEALLLEHAEDPSPEIGWRRVEYYCNTLQHAAALQALEHLGGAAVTPDHRVALIGALYAASGDWEAVLALFYDRVLPADWRRADPHLFEAAARAARRTGAQAELLERLEGRIAKVENPFFSAFRDQIAQEVAMLRALDAPDDANSTPSAMPIANQQRARHAELMARLLKPATAGQVDQQVYFCTDLNYLLGTCVAMFSLLKNNMPAARRMKLTVFSSEDAFDLASEVLGHIGAGFGVTIEVRSAALLGASEHNLMTDWGVFTPGHALSEAAYYRIFAAQLMLREGASGRALYLDSDILVGPGVDGLVHFDLQGRPLGARLEIPTMEGVRRAAAKLEITPEEYFNSGVLLFDLSHPDLASSLEHSVEVALHRQHQLTHLDQCALNLGFRTRFTPLPADCNLFLRTDSDVSEIRHEPVVWHFVERPKPWDPAYATANATRWLDMLAAMATVLPLAQLKRLLSVQFANT